MKLDKGKKDSYESLKEKLSNNEVWPLRYMFKFIVPNSEGKVDLVKSYMPANGKVTFKHTSSLKFVSITCVAEMNSAEEIIEITRKANSVSGVIPL